MLESLSCACCSQPLLMVLSVRNYSSKLFVDSIEVWRHSTNFEKVIVHGLRDNAQKGYLRAKARPSQKERSMDHLVTASEPDPKLAESR